MGRIFNFNDVQTSRLVQNCHANLKIVNLESRRTQATGVLMYVIDSAITAPATEAGKQYTEFCVFGKVPFNTDKTDPEFVEFAELDDPDAEDPITMKFSIGASSFKRIFENAGIDFAKDVDMDNLMEVAASQSLEFGAHIVLETEADTGKQRNKLGAVYKSGAEEPRLIAATKRGKPAAKTGSKGSAKGSAASHSRRTRTAAEDDQD